MLKRVFDQLKIIYSVFISWSLKFLKLDPEPIQFKDNVSKGELEKKISVITEIPSS